MGNLCVAIHLSIFSPFTLVEFTKNVYRSSFWVKWVVLQRSVSDKNRFKGTFCFSLFPLWMFCALWAGSRALSRALSCWPTVNPLAVEPVHHFLGMFMFTFHACLFWFDASNMFQTSCDRGNKRRGKLWNESKKKKQQKKKNNTHTCLEHSTCLNPDVHFCPVLSVKWYWIWKLSDKLTFLFDVRQTFHR